MTTVTNNIESELFIPCLEGHVWVWGFTNVDRSEPAPQSVCACGQMTWAEYKAFESNEGESDE